MAQFVAPIVMLVALWGCGGGGGRQISGPGTGGGTGTPDVGRLVIHVSVEEGASDLASSLGWEDGVPDAEVHLLRNGTKTWKKTTTGGRGDAQFPNLLRGLYRVYVGRTLTAQEASSAGLAVRAFGDGATVEVKQGGGPAPRVEDRAGRGWRAGDLRARVLDAAGI